MIGLLVSAPNNVVQAQELTPVQRRSWSEMGGHVPVSLLRQEHAKLKNVQVAATRRY